MAYNAIELGLIHDLRVKMGDTPTRVLTADDVGATAYIEGVSFVVLQADVGKDVDDLTKQIWNDSEYYTNLKTSLALTFKGTKTDFNTLDTYEKALVLIAAQIVFTYELAYVASRYTKYKMRDVDVEKTSPDEFVRMAESLRDYLQTFLDEGSDTGSITPKVAQSIVRRLDKMSMEMKPEIYQPDAKLLDFILTESNGTVVIDIPYSFVVDYKGHFIKKMTGGETILIDYDKLKTEQYVDSNVTAGQTYVYRVYIQTLNDEYYYKEKSITLASP